MFNKKYVSTRIQSSNNSKNINNIYHNLRTNGKRVYKPSRSTTEHKHDNYLLFNETEYKNNKQIIEQTDAILEIRQKWINEHEELYKKNNGNRKLRNYHASIMEGVLTFSPEIMEELKKGKLTYAAINNRAKGAITKIAEELNTEILYISGHWDEKTLHYHYHMKNFDKEGKSINKQVIDNQSRLNKGNDTNPNITTLSALQDIAGECFKDIGYNRGIQKEFTEKNYMKIEHYYNKKEQQLKEQQEELKQLIKKLKEEREEVKKDIKLSKEQKKEQYSQITTLQKEIREIQKQARDIKQSTDIELKEQIIKDINNLLDKSRGGVLNNIQEKELKQNLYKTLKNTHIKEREQKKVIELLQDELEELKDIKETDTIKHLREELNNKERELITARARTEEKERELISEKNYTTSLYKKNTEQKEELRKKEKELSFKNTKITELQQQLSIYTNKNRTITI